MTPEELRRMTGVDRLPMFADAMRESMARHYPPALHYAGIGGSVLADVHIDAAGTSIRSISCRGRRGSAR
jgi:hypothetical protein